MMKNSMTRNFTARLNITVEYEDGQGEKMLKRLIPLIEDALLSLSDIVEYNGTRGKAIVRQINAIDLEEEDSSLHP